MRLLTIVSGIALVAAPLAAQELPDFITDLSTATQEPAAGDPSAEEGTRELSELERLSRLEDDPFAGVLEREAREPVSVTLRALDKVTARYTDIEIAMNEIARFGSLELQPRTCDKRPPEEFPETTAFLEIFDTKSYSASNWKREIVIEEAAPADAAETADAQPNSYDPMLTAPERLPGFGADTAEAEDETGDLQADFIAALEQGVDEPVDETASMPAPEVLEGPQAEGENIFRGWMFASSPALNALEHPVYDVWVIDCKTRVASN